MRLKLQFRFCCQLLPSCLLYKQTHGQMISSYHPAAHRWAQSCSWCSPRWSCQSRPSWRHTSCTGTRTPWRRWHSAWWRPPTRCWSAWHGRSWCGRCWSPGIEPAAGRGSRSRETHPQRYAWDGREGEDTEKERERDIYVGSWENCFRVNTIPLCDILWKH